MSYAETIEIQGGDVQGAYNAGYQVGAAVNKAVAFAVVLICLAI